MSRILYNGIVLLAIVFFVPSIVPAQTSGSSKQSSEEIAVTNMITEKNYLFVANTVMPLRGMTQQLTTAYDLRISGDTVIAYLPYFGRVYSAPISTGGINFSSADNSYLIKERKKGGWDISIKPRVQTDVRELNLTVFSNGSASLRVTSNNRDPISYNGYIQKKR